MRLKIHIIYLFPILFYLSCEKESDKSPSELTIHGIVSDSYSHEPIQGAKVTLVANNSSVQHSQVTGMDGRYSMTIEKPNNYSYFNVLAYGYDPLEGIELINQASTTVLEEDIIKKDFSMRPVLIEFPISGRFEAPATFIITNNHESRYFIIDITVFNESYLYFGETKTHTMSIGAKETFAWEYDYFLNKWEKGDYVTITIPREANMNKTWNY